MSSKYEYGAETALTRVLAGKTAIITGASRGVGRAFAAALADAGANVILMARASAELEAARENIGKCATAIACDVSNPDSVRKAFSTAGRLFGKVDILINNAAICRPYMLHDASDADILAEVSVNLIGPMLCAREAIPLLIASGGGDIVNISSESVRMPFPHLTVYTATKGGLETFTAGLRTELRPLGIRVTTMRLGNVLETGINRDWPAENAAALAHALQESGHAAFTGKGGSAATVSQAMLNLLSLPRDFNTDLIELRSL
jgi:NAD(P)-dependent dehydrogenase (short-subunit alcohol dehydrogenase family)